MSNASDDNGQIIVDGDYEHDHDDAHSACSIGKIDPEELAMAYHDRVDEEEEDEEEEDDDDDDSSNFSGTDESSTTSTSSTNNQQDNTRVCDCCYCEVFGHGTSHVAPTSRNFNEMRERLRQRLSKRRAERCERSTQQQQQEQQKGTSNNQNENSNDKGGGVGAPPSGDDDVGFKSSQSNANQPNKQQPYALMEIEDILNYINGTSQDKASNNKKKDKDKNKSSSSNNNNSNNRKNKNKSNAAPTKEEPKYSEKCHQAHHNSSNGNNLHSNNSACQQNNLSMPQKRHQTNSNHSNETHSNHPPEHHHNHNGGAGRRSSCSGEGANLKGNKSSKSENVLNRNPSNDQAFRSTSNSEKHRRKDRDKTSNKLAKTQNIPSKTATTLCDDDLKDSLFTEPDDVFLPRDIDLNDDDLDEFERELEAFKRFCLDSVTLKKKERVRVQLRDSSCFKIFNHRCIAAIENKIAIQ